MIIFDNNLIIFDNNLIIFNNNMIIFDNIVRFLGMDYWLKKITCGCKIKITDLEKSELSM